MPVPVVYVDVVWLVNFIMDGVILWTTCWVMKRPARPRRLVMAALLGSGYSLLLFVPPLSFLTTWVGKALVSVALVGIGIPCRSWLELARTTVLFYFVTFVFAGAALALNFAVPGVSVASGVEVAGRRLAFVTSLRSLGLLLAIVLSIALLQYSLQRVRRLRVRAAALYRVHVTVDGRSASFVGLADTGNQLRDPLTRKPVCLVQAQVMAELVPEALAVPLREGKTGIEALSSIQDESWVRRLSIVPYRGAGGVQQMTFAVRPDTVEIEENGVRRPAAAPVLLAVNPGKLSLDNQFQAILHIEAIARDDRVEESTYTSNAGHETQDSIATSVGSNSTEAGGRF
ncbi:sigma-E processing peptidase SpoIIGA [Alicyclobacillus cycloheptanicus]|uniref:Stage II sporulation protein GA (Sporulation sigma-E factor processing peptidase) n=1 Tax=Alicyclobacillus cycloheptanicus TaxID=1457 RepID=A0ABT9XKY7_9BACL|nr:sigma-E processing peptidase SpoIIGA [Alicyclobacillus cycloheptanicus]MDQ0190979.1 stage II sporulation protein GA (sporulation sigma-E factor processing peptidase) [Alicyclobacillus cycloheptanicus]WDM01493.1 sigma-E processing peptidase SpoIIGA [Alicyclobacillus cycloheptanicus]